MTLAVDEREPVGPLHRLLQRVVDVRANEVSSMLTSFAFFFFLLSSFRFVGLADVFGVSFFCTLSLSGFAGVGFVLSHAGKWRFRFLSRFFLVQGC